MIAFNLGEPDFGTPQNICDAAKAAIDAQKTKYTVVSGIMDLKEAICAKILKRQQCRLQTERDLYRNRRKTAARQCSSCPL